MLRTRAEKRRTLIVHKDFLFLCPPVNTDQIPTCRYIFKTLRQEGWLVLFIGVEYLFNCNESQHKHNEEKTEETLCLVL